MANQPWDPHSDPIVGPYGPPQSGLHQTKSGRVVNQNGQYVNAPSPSTMAKVNAHEQESGTIGPGGVIVRPPRPAGPTTQAQINERQRILSYGTTDSPLGKPPAKPSPKTPPHGDPTKGAPTRTTAANPNTGAAPGGDMSTILGMITALLKGGNPSALLPTSLAAQAAAPQNALASSYQSQLDALPAAKAEALKNIGDWYGLVKASEGKAASKDQAMATALSDAAKGNAAGIAAGLGGAAMPGSAQIGAVGANDANTMAAIGASDKQLADELGPIFDLSAAGAKNTRSQQFDNAKMSLQNSLAQAQGQASADKANALMQIINANNGARQSNLANKADLVKTLASLEITGMNAASSAQSAAMLNALRQSEIDKNKAKAVGGYAALTPMERQSLANNITKGIVDPNSGKLATDWPTALRNARNSVREAGLNPGDPNVINSIIGPALANAGITNQGGGFWSAIYQP